ncbi:signal recognition particle subunit SRP19/SEC65 family protein [Methanotorris igneus]|uniref:Signal recognition particle 19 kDa protein n=1 Tax=Methanotorris igneus (strain DSM 5666 / JCM 11834 / Kol 5) TaxID=880724 RepID=F6BBW0_METIK|nr:signal recognition particle subunit SRP19/SEC65 family protein [Methanotorris igneus]AEF97240.1 Signal recognition particle 19 kDa protein [Methanotorris igneus Kol 5]
MIIWPNYIDKNKSRKEGRKVPKDIAIENPKLKEIEAALKKMGYNVKVYRDKCYPREHWRICGCIEVDAKAPKLQFLKKLCEVMKSQ